MQPSSSGSGAELAEEDNDWLAPSERVTTLKTEYRELEKKIKQLPMELPDTITSLLTAIALIIDKKQMTVDDADTLQLYLNNLNKSINDMMTL